MSIITEEMAVEYHKCSLYKDYIEQLQISEKNAGDEFMQSLRCSNIYVPDPKEVTEKYRKMAQDQGIDNDWIDKFMPQL
ncbi:MAG: hypothetical protein J6O70_07000 [Lachnospiraceae bacterium]|nr:hypothetical protein [Lachnospiraceae bacterium]